MSRRRSERAHLVGPGHVAPAVAAHRRDRHEVVQDFCGDLTVQVDLDVHGSFLFNAHGPDGLAMLPDAKPRASDYLWALAAIVMAALLFRQLVVSVAALVRTWTVEQLLSFVVVAVLILVSGWWLVGGRMATHLYYRDLVHPVLAGLAYWGSGAALVAIIRRVEAATHPEQRAGGRGSRCCLAPSAS